MYTNICIIAPICAICFMEAIDIPGVELSIATEAGCLGRKVMLKLDNSNQIKPVPKIEIRPQTIMLATSSRKDMIFQYW